MKPYLSQSTAQTEAFAARLAARLRPGDVIAFNGGLGAGKTAFVRGLAAGLGVSGEVASPTFSLVHEHPGPVPLYHFDMYRVESFDALYSTGFFDYLESGGILAVEWSENIEGALPENAIRVRIGIVGETAREITISGDERFEDFSV